MDDPTTKSLNQPPPANSTLPQPPIPPDPAHAAADLRGERIADYVEAALTSADPLEANLGVVNGDLMRMANLLTQVLGECLLKPPETLQGMATLMPAVDAHLKVTKQIGSLSQLILKLQTLHGD